MLPLVVHKADPNAVGDGAGAGDSEGQPAYTCVAPKTCALLRKLRDGSTSTSTSTSNSGFGAGLVTKGTGLAAQATHNAQGSDMHDAVRTNTPDDGALTGVGYYLLRPGAKIQKHAGPTNERLTCHLTLKVNSSCCPLSAPPYYPFPRGKYILGVIYGVSLWPDMNAGTPLGALGRSVMSLERAKRGAFLVRTKWLGLTTFPIFYAICMRNHRIKIGNVRALCNFPCSPLHLLLLLL